MLQCIHEYLSFPSIGTAHGQYPYPSNQWTCNFCTCSMHWDWEDTKCFIVTNLLWHILCASSLSTYNMQQFKLNYRILGSFPNKYVIHIICPWTYYTSVYYVGLLLTLVSIVWSTNKTFLKLVKTWSCVAALLVYTWYVFECRLLYELKSLKFSFIYMYVLSKCWRGPIFIRILNDMRG